MPSTHRAIVSAAIGRPTPPRPQPSVTHPIQAETTLLAAEAFTWVTATTTKIRQDSGCEQVPYALAGTSPARQPVPPVGRLPRVRSSVERASRHWE